MKKVLLLSHKMVIGGSEKTLLNLGSLLHKAGYQIHLLVLRNIFELEVPKDFMLHPLFVPQWIRAKFLYEKFFSRYIQKLDQCYHYEAIFSNFTTTRQWLPADIENKTFYYVHFNYEWQYNKLSSTHSNKAKKLKKKIHQYYNHRQVIAVSEGVKKSLYDTFQVVPKRIEVIFNFFDFKDVHRLAQVYTPVVKRKYIIHVARFDVQQKRQDLLLEAFGQIKTDVDLVMITQSCNALTALINKHTKKNNIKVVEFNKNPYPWIRQAELLVLSSDVEGFGNVLVESLICQTPVISTNCLSGPGEILKGKMSEWLVEVNNAEALASKIDQYFMKNNYIIDHQHLNLFQAKQALQKLKSLISNH